MIVYPNGMSVVKTLVLGAIKRRTHAHGYRIYRDLKDWRVETWTVVRPGSIYHAMSQLEKEKYIEATRLDSGDQKLGPAKTEFTLTNAGERLFMDLLEASFKNINLIELSVGIAFMEYLPRARVVELLQERAAAQRQLASFVQALPTEEIPSTPAKHPELTRIWSESYDHAAASTDKLIKAITSGEYLFKNKEVK
jgi:DNA-binding PadR family transcriptional regulator